MPSLRSKIESLLFISAKPMSLRQLSEAAKVKEAEVKAAGDGLVEDYKNSQAGIQIIKNGSKYQMVSAPENSQLVRDFINDETTGELSRPSLETLTIIAYRGPIAKADLDRIRGVNCSLILRNLLIRGLVEVKTRKEDEEQIYSVSLDFVRFLGINDVSELPDFQRLSQDDLIDRILEAEAALNSKITSAPESAEAENSSPQETGQEEQELVGEAGLDEDELEAMLSEEEGEQDEDFEEGFEDDEEEEFEDEEEEFEDEEEEFEDGEEEFEDDEEDSDGEPEEDVKEVV